MTEDFRFEGSFEEHRLAQMKRMAKETTPEQRWQWLDEALRFVWSQGIDPNEKQRRMQGKGRDNW